ncbi:MAG TPA: hypothetical protein VGQ57_03525, partial [Polyangiaceae bacterium]|nr:hypothetical protein [Polyangiaceae bacterium]
TPTGHDRITITGVSVVTGSGVSGISQSGISSAGGSLPGVAPPSTRSVSEEMPDPNRAVAIVAYAVGVAGILIAIAVLYLSGH